MGFHIQISGDGRQMLDVLHRKPYALFAEPYAAYLLFLFEDIDEHVWSWFKEHARRLDSLTGSDVAFAVFSHRARFRIQVPYSRGGRPPGRKTLDVSDATEEKTYNVESLIKAGRCGWVADGDEISAVNEAVHLVAREAGLMSHLPCVLVVDGLPHPATPPIWIPMEKNDLPALYGRIRRAIGKLQSHPHIQPYQTGLRGIANAVKWSDYCQKKVDVAKLQPPAIKREMEDVEPREAQAASFVDQLNQFRQELSVAAKRAFKERVKVLSRRLPFLDWSRALGDLGWDEIRSHLQSIYALQKYLAEPWPLSAERIERLAHIHAKYLSQLLADCPFESSFDSPNLIRTWCGRLEGQLAGLVERGMSAVPSIEDFLRAVDAAESDRRGKLESTLAEANARLEEFETQLRDLELGLVGASRRVYQINDPPSLCRILLSDGSPAHSTAKDRQPSPAPAPSISNWMDWPPVRVLIDWLRRRSFWRLPEMGYIPPLLNESAALHRSPTAFASYATEDRDDVISRIQGMKAWQPGLDVFIDFSSLNPGDQWNSRLTQEIGKRDRFFLFWSRAASQSQYVAEEWRTALKLRGLSSITPVPLEPPHVAPPPAELAELHFNDFFTEFLYLRRTPQTAPERR